MMLWETVFAQSDKITNEVEQSFTSGCLDIPPRYPGGHKGITRFLANHVKYPRAVHGKLLNCRIIISFAVDSFGNTTEIRIIKGCRPDFDFEALRIVSLLNGWIPATVNGKKIIHYQTIPIVFRAGLP
jgi:outer membrane biosynthesis protein TonB